MTHYAHASFWSSYSDLPNRIRNSADKGFALLQENPEHPSLHFKRVGRYWSARVSREYRALAVPVDDGFLWFWIGTHTEYDRMIG